MRNVIAEKAEQDRFDAVLERGESRSLGPSERELMIISKSVGGDWEELAFLLGLSSYEIERCKLRGGGGSLQCMSALVAWRRKGGSDATYARIGEAMRSARVSTECVRLLAEFAASAAAAEV